VAPLPPDNTARLKIFYNTCGHEHTCQIRLAEGVTVDDAAADFNALVTAMGGAVYGSTYVAAQLAISGSNVFNDVVADWPVGWGGTAGPEVATADYFDFIGRSPDGRRVRFALFGATAATAADRYRVFAADSSPVNGAVAVLNAAEGTFVSINAFQPVWKPYANLGPNAYWRNKIR
jgi:hypothetical protein